MLRGVVARVLVCAAVVVAGVLGTPSGALAATPAGSASSVARALAVPATTPTSSGSFADVPSGSQFSTEIQWLADQGISTGWIMPDGTRQYRPLLPVARDAMAAFMYRLAGSPAFTPPADSPFTDITPSAQFYKEITWLDAQGISTGWQMPDGTRQYRPLEPVGRDAMAAFMYRLDASPAFTPPADSPFADITPGTQFYKEITWLATNGISTGWTEADGSKTYRPLDAVARDAMAAFMYRFYQLTHPQAAVVGNDVSWPQCGATMPSGQAFAVVGVNNGTASSTNPCLASELSWASTSAGGTSQPRVALYVNTANPGTAGSWWPSSNTYAGTPVSNPYGLCAGLEDAACSYMYGYAKAYDDVTSRGVSSPASYTWWLDVETSNSWSTDPAANTADLEGMAYYFNSIGARIGIYSSSAQWAQIVGTVPSTSSLYSLSSWLAGASTPAAAQAGCSATPLTGGGKVALTQYISGAYDYDHSCV
ncbi:S-layer homology domain-containing protein [Sinomonas susongensis]|uniref:S-layer homology domain-containing protein n=1 Tax=Sinomonas susongensis TaxID=1324851 RepID=UPI0011098754|nr:S-layer homology domain-containing protein [Sinomonas susongensis]